MTAFIRPYNPSTDDAAMIHIFRETAHHELQIAGDLALHYASYNWARPYMLLVPEHCFVIDDGDGTPVGYLLGAPDTRQFVADWKSRYLPFLRSQGFTEPPPLTSGSAVGGEAEVEGMAMSMQRITWRPESMLQQDFPDLLRNYPAHLHVDILPSHQGQGYGRQLLELIIDRFHGMGVVGIHLGKVGTNFGAGVFYSKLGFERFPEVMDDGKSGEVGTSRDGGVYMIKKL